MRNSGWNEWRHLRLPASFTASVLVVMSATFFVAPSAQALGLGEIDTRSALNERFAAEIELLDTRDLDASEVLASLASTDDFRRVGVERFFFLTSLKFDVVRNGRGNLVITASSAQPITEPYLNFLVEVLWPSGRLLKEYTVLLDPPTFTHSTAAPVAAPSRESTDIASAGRVQRGEPAASTNAPSTGKRASNPAPKSAGGDGTYGKTTRNDTMWAIANQTLPSNNVTPQQNMLAIQRLNPNAFIDGNVNLLKAGVVLRLPTEADAQAIDSAAAVTQVNDQNRSWRAGTPARSVAANADSSADSGRADNQANAAPIDATSRGPGNADTAPTNEDGRLTIVATDSTGVVDGLDNTGAGETQTAVAGDPEAQERIENLARQVDELTYQLDLQKRGVEEQISSREKQINLKDQQIAQLQQQLQSAQDSGSAQSQDQNTPTQSAVEDKPFWQQPTILGGILGGLALLLAGVLFKRRQVSASEDLEIDEFEASEPSFELGPTGTSDVVTPLGDADLVGDLNDADLALEQADSVQHEADLAEEISGALDDDELSDDDLFGPADDAAPAAAAAGDAPQTSDVIGEADIYIAYGRYPQAIALLQGAVDTNPADHAVRMRLLEVSAETKDAESYAEQSQLMKKYCDDTDTLNRAESHYSALDDDFRAEVDGIASNVSDDDSGSTGLAGVVAGAGAAVVAGAASLLGDDDQNDAQDSGASSDADSFAFDTTVTDDLGESVNDLADDADSLLTGEFGLADSLDENVDLDADVDSVGEFELDLDLDAASDSATDAVTDVSTDIELPEFDVPSVNTDEFATNVDMSVADTPLENSLETSSELDLGIEAAAEVEDFELDLDLSPAGADADGTGTFAIDNAADTLGGDLGLDFPDETSELARVVAETDDDQLLDEIERSLDELEADGLLTPELNDDAEFSFDDDADTSATKLDLARAYIDMGDDDGAREILDEVISEGDSSQQGEASELLGKL